MLTNDMILPLQFLAKRSALRCLRQIAEGGPWMARPLKTHGRVPPDGIA
jgi:hypothetical protein